LGILTFLQLFTSIPIHLGDAERELDYGITLGFAAAILSKIGFVLHKNYCKAAYLSQVQRSRGTKEQRDGRMRDYG